MSRQQPDHTEPLKEAVEHEWCVESSVSAAAGGRGVSALSTVAYMCIMELCLSPQQLLVATEVRTTRADVHCTIGT